MRNLFLVFSLFISTSLFGQQNLVEENRVLRELSIRLVRQLEESNSALTTALNTIKTLEAERDLLKGRVEISNKTIEEQNITIGSLRETIVADMVEINELRDEIIRLQEYETNFSVSLFGGYPINIGADFQAKIPNLPFYGKAGISFGNRIPELFVGLGYSF